MSPTTATSPAPLAAPASTPETVAGDLARPPRTPPATAPIVALSADVLDLHREACREAGMDDHIGKPINPTELLTKVAMWCAAGAEADLPAQIPA